MMQEIPFIMAFVAGIVSFLSPCVLPLVPAYLSFISGMSVSELATARGRPAAVKQAAIHALCFILGFSSIFVALGASATAIGQFLQARMDLFSKIGGIIVVLLGLHIAGIWRIGLLMREKHLVHTDPHKGLAGSFLTGLAFAFAWTPCIGPILGAILTVSAAQETVGRGVLLLSLYSLGLGLPFLCTALATHSFLIMFGRIRSYVRAIEVGAGCLVMLMGLLILTDNMTWMAGQLTLLNRFAW